MASRRFPNLKNTIQKFSLSPSKDEKPRKKLSYSKKMKLRYNLTDKEFENLKKEADKQLANWKDYRKEQVLQIFQTTSEYVSKSKKSDVVHPKLARAKTVMNRQGQMVEVEFGRLREYYLYTLAPSKEFVWIRDQANHDKQLDGVRKKQQQNFDKQKDKQKERRKLQAEYEQSKSVYEEAGAPRQSKPVTPEPKESAEETAPLEQFVANTTDEKRCLFSDTWYKKSISRSQLKPGKMLFWMGNEDDDDQLIDDDPEGKYTVTAERMIESLTAGGKVKDSGVVEPTNGLDNMAEPLEVIQAKYRKSSGREVVFLNTLKGTIDFMRKQNATEKTVATNTISQDEPTDAFNQITFDNKIIAHVFPKARLKRQLEERKDLETYEEERKDYTREAGEETSGI